MAGLQQAYDGLFNPIGFKGEAESIAKHHRGTQD